MDDPKSRSLDSVPPQRGRGYCPLAKVGCPQPPGPALIETTEIPEIQHWELDLSREQEAGLVTGVSGILLIAVLFFVLMGAI